MSIQLNGINCFYGAHQALFDIMAHAVAFVGNGASMTRISVKSSHDQLYVMGSSGVRTVKTPPSRVTRCDNASVS